MSGVTLRAPEAWAESQFANAALGDRRRSRRAVKLAAAMAGLPGGSIPAQAGTWADTKAGYRLFDCDDVTYEALIAPHVSQVRELADQRSIVLMIQDSSELNFTHHAAVSGLGPVGNRQGRGFMLHSTLAIDPSGEGEVLGLAHQILWCRDGIQPEESKAKRKHRHRESQIWCQSVEAVGFPPPNARWIHVCDRYGDFFELFEMCRRQSADLIIRMAQDRRCSPGHHQPSEEVHLMQWARSLPACGEKTLSLRSRPKRMAREARLRIAHSPVTVFEPRLGRCGAPPFQGWLVRVWEPDAPEGEAPIEWVLLTSAPVNNTDDARQILHWYSLRWLIEEYHKCLKTGCAVEGRQLETRRRLEACIGMLAVLAVRLLGLKLLVRRDAKSDIKPHVSPLHLRVLAAYRGTTTASKTAYEFWREVAKLGGFLGRKGDGEPGWQTLWRGWQQLESMTLGAALMQNELENYG